VLLHAKQVEWMLTKQTLMDWHAFDATPAAAGSSGGGGKPAAELAILERL
jgi:hypothetical protein